MSSDYAQFLAGKKLTAPAVGFDVAPEALPVSLFPWQRQVTRWALRIGRAAIWADTGLGKGAMGLSWAQAVCRHAGPDGAVLVLAPLAVAQQFKREAEKFGIELPVLVAKSQEDVPATGQVIVLANYERFRLGYFRPERFTGVVCDESGILANYTGKTKRQVIEAFRQTPYRLSLSATPAPNDTVELCNHADFLSVMPQQEMLSRFFTPKGVENASSGQYRLKNHAQRDFYRWLASWALAVRKPSDIGYDDAGYQLPPLEIVPHFVQTEWAPPGQLFLTQLKGVTERAAVRRDTVAERVQAVAELVQREPHEPWLIWYGLLSEADGLARLLPEATIVRGSDADERKEQALLDFAEGRLPVLVTHAKIAGLGMNFQRCARLAFIGMDDSFSQYYQAIRRCWRFGQTRPVYAHLVLAEPQRAIYENVLRKEAEAAQWGSELLAAVRDYERAELAGAQDVSDIYAPTLPMRLPPWLTSVAASAPGIQEGSHAW